MSESEDSLCAAAAMVRHEELVGELYGTFAEKFPDQRDLWSELSRDETGHANLIRRLCGKIEKGLVNINARSFKTKAVETSLAYLDILRDRAHGEMSRQMALSIALQIENSMLEMKFFEVLEVDETELSAVFRALNDGTIGHVKKLEHARAGMVEEGDKQ